MTDNDSLCCCHYHIVPTPPHLSHYDLLHLMVMVTEAAHHDYEMLLLPVLFALFEQNCNEHYETIIQILIFTIMIEEVLEIWRRQILSHCHVNNEPVGGSNRARLGQGSKQW